MAVQVEQDFSIPFRQLQRCFCCAPHTDSLPFSGLFCFQFCIVNSPQKKFTQGVDELIQQTSLDQVLSHFHQPLPTQTTGEHRMPCVFNENCAESSYGSLTINQSDVAKRIFCHSCGVRGNLLTLLWGLSQHCPPTSGKLRGDEFKETVVLLKEIRRNETHEMQSPEKPVPAESLPPEDLAFNTPLKDSDNERARQLVTLHETLITNPDEMNPAAAAYFRKRPWLSPDVAHQWRMGYLPHSAKSLLRGRIVYAYPNEQNEILSYFGRDPAFDQKWNAWKQSGAREKNKPMKHRFVKGFQRGLELFGQNGSQRLAEHRLQESLRQIGLVVVEGPNDVIRLDCLNVGAVGLCSNQATDTQVSKIVTFAKQVAGGQVVLLPDCDSEGEAGFKDLLWKLNEHQGIHVRLGWSSAMFDSQFANRQPESLTTQEWSEISAPL